MYLGSNSVNTTIFMGGESMYIPVKCHKSNFHPQLSKMVFNNLWKVCIPEQEKSPKNKIPVQITPLTLSVGFAANIPP